MGQAGRRVGGGGGDRLLVASRLGGELPPDTFAENEAYDPKSKRSRTLTAMPAGRHGTSAAVIGKSIFIAAGSLKPGSGAVTDQLIVYAMPLA